MFFTMYIVGLGTQKMMSLFYVDKKVIKQLDQRRGGIVLTFLFVWTG